MLGIAHNGCGYTNVPSRTPRKQFRVTYIFSSFISNHIILYLIPRESYSPFHTLRLQRLYLHLAYRFTLWNSTNQWLRGKSFKQPGRFIFLYFKKRELSTHNFIWHTFPISASSLLRCIEGEKVMRIEGDAAIHHTARIFHTPPELVMQIIKISFILV